MNNQFPASLLKFDTYTETQTSLSDAIQLAKDKQLAFGQPAIIPFTDENTDVMRLLFVVGSNNPDIPCGTVLTNCDNLVYMDNQTEN